MAVDKLVDSTQLDADLTSVANAIRTKGGTSASLAFPAGFVSAVEAIPAGGGGVKTGTFTPAERTTSVSIDIGISDYSGILVMPESETPLKSGGKTFDAGFYTKNSFYKAYLGTSNNAGSGRAAATTLTSSGVVSMSGTVATIYSSKTNPSINAGSFETITYRWVAW